MSILGKLKTFYGATPVLTSEVEDIKEPLSFRIVRYAISLLYDPKLAETYEQTLHQLELAAPSARPEQEVALANCYLEIERALIEREPVRKFTREVLRRQIGQHFSLDHSSEGLALLFSDPVKQEIKLALLFANALIENLAKIVNISQLETLIRPALNGTPLAGARLTDKGIDLTPVQEMFYALPPEQLRLILTDLTRVFELLFEKEEQLEGNSAAVAMFENLYAQLKQTYGTFINGLSQVAIMTPGGVLENEKVGFMTRETLEQKVLEKTKQLQTEKDSVERQIKDRTRELREERAKLQSSIEAMPLGLLMVDAAHKVIVANPTVSKILNYGERPWGFSDLVHDLGSAFNLAAKCDEVRDKKHPVDFQEVTVGAKVLRLSLSPVLASHHVLGVVILMEDITEAKVLQRSREEFFSIASHELRTPLTAIKGNASLLLRYYGDALKDKTIHEMVDDIHDSSVHLIEIVNDFLDTSRLEQGKISFKPQPVELDKIIERVLYEMGPVLHQKGLYCKVDEHITRFGSLPSIFADPDRTKQIIYNLIGNAVKFTANGGISIRAGVEGDHLKVWIADTGVGIPVENQKLLFHKFQQAGSSILTRDTTRGTGLGLYISKLLSEGMHGSIKLESSVPGKGTTFSFTLPIATPNQTQATVRVAAG